MKILRELKKFIKSIGWHWLIRLYKFQVYNSIIDRLYIALCVHYLKVKSPSITIYLTLFTLLTFPSANHSTVVCVWVFFVCFVCSFVAFCFTSHLWVKSYGPCLFLSDLLCVAWYFQGPSILPQMAIGNSKSLSFFSSTYPASVIYKEHLG